MDGTIRLYKKSNKTIYFFKKSSINMELKEVRHLLTYDCMLRCKHCYLSAGENPVESLDFTQEQSDEFYGHFRPAVVSATGGEPLLKQGLVMKIARSTEAYGGSMELVTNGLLLTEKLVKELGETNGRTFYQISLDGNRKYHDMLRNWNGAYDGAMKAIGIASESGALTKVRMTVTEENFQQIPEVISSLDAYGRENILLVMRPVVTRGRALANGLKFGGADFSELDGFGARHISVETTDNKGKCGCGVDTVAVDPKGDIYPCTYFASNPKYLMGNITGQFRGLSEHAEFAGFRGTCYARHSVGAK